MSDEKPIEQNIAPGDDAFDPAQLDDAALQEFLGLSEPAPAEADAPLPDASNQESAEADAAADKALESALVPDEPVVAPAVKTAAVAEEPKEKAEPKPAGGGESKVSDGKKPLYVAYGADGKPLAEVPIKEVEITVGGKVKRVDLDRLARMASSGGYNEQLQDEVKQAREIAARAQQFEQATRQLQAERDAILRDPDYYLKQVEQYAAQQSPEARAERAERQVQALTGQQQQQQAAAYVAQQAETTIQPKLEALVAEYPHVTGDELVAQFTTLIRPFVPPGGMLPPQMVPHVLDVIDRAIAPWAAQLHDAREERQKATAATTAAEQATQSAKADSAKAAAKVTKAKADISRTIAPVGRGTAKPVAPRAKPLTANEAADAALEDALNFAINQPSS